MPSDLRSAILLNNQAREAELLAMIEANTDNLIGSQAGADDSIEMRSRIAGVVSFDPSPLIGILIQFPIRR